MKWLPDKLGADPKKVAILAVLVVVLGIVYFMNRTPDSGVTAASTSPAPSRGTTAPVTAGPAASSPGVPPVPPRNLPRRSEISIQDFKPTLKLPEGVDISRIEPSLRLDLLAKLHELPMAGGERSVFDFGPAPKPVIPAVQPIKPAPPAAPAPPNAPPAVTAAPAKPAPPPIPLKFYGYVNGSTGGTRQAFFLEGDEIHVAGESDVIHNRYRVVRIGVNSAVVEDTVTHNQQTLPLVEELQG
jgi:hypothetical protein